MIRVLVVEDSGTARELLVWLLENAPERMSVVGQAKNGVEAVEMTRALRPDVITMDIRMPLMDGLAAIRRIMAETPTPIVVVSGRDVLEMTTSMDALRDGALAVLEKPVGPNLPGFDERCREIIDTVRLMAGVKVVRRFGQRYQNSSTLQKSTHDSVSIPRYQKVRALGIATSTGGPAALKVIFSSLPEDFHVPILVVQHIARGFVEGLAGWLDSAAGLRVKVATADELVQPGSVYLAPDDRHLGLTGAGRISLSDGPRLDGFRPSGSYLFASLAESLGKSALGLVLTGMGHDGLEGLRKLRSAGGRVLAQDEASSVVFGMPGACIEAALADEVISLDAMAARLLELTA